MQGDFTQFRVFLVPALIVTAIMTVGTVVGCGLGARIFRYDLSTSPRVGLTPYIIKLNYRIDPNEWPGFLKAPVGELVFPASQRVLYGKDGVSWQGTINERERRRTKFGEGS